VLSLAAGGMGFFINSAFRKALYLDRSSRFSSYVATVGVPAFSAGAGHVIVRIDFNSQRCDSNGRVYFIIS